MPTHSYRSFCLRSDPVCWIHRQGINSTWSFRKSPVLQDGLIVWRSGNLRSGGWHGMAANPPSNYPTNTASRKMMSSLQSPSLVIVPNSILFKGHSKSQQNTLRNNRLNRAMLFWSYLRGSMFFLNYDAILKTIMKIQL